MTIHYKGCEDTALKEAFLVLFGIACAKDAFDTAHVENSFSVIKWNVSFAKAAHNWEVDVFASFFRVLYLARMRQEREDRLWWFLSKRWLFGVKSLYIVMGCQDGFHFP